MTQPISNHPPSSRKNKNMPKDRVPDLLQKCVTARAGGADFPSIWNKLLKGHPLVAGLPIQGLAGNAARLEVPLITGERLIYGDAGFSIG